MVQARAQLAWDFAGAHRGGRLWWKGLSWVLDRLESENAARILDLQHRLHCTMLVRAEDHKIAQRALDAAKRIQKSSESLLMGDHDNQVGAAGRSDWVRWATDVYRRLFGDGIEQPKTHESVE